MFCFWIYNNQRILWAISRIIFRKYCHKDLQKCRANSSLSEMEKYKRENNQLKCRHGLQMNHFKDSSLSLEYANSCDVILLWFCSDDHQNWLLHTAELLGKMQIVFVLLILTVTPRPLNYHAIEISSSYSNCFKESYIWESKGH